MKKRSVIICLISLIVYFALLALLTLAESASPDASIRSIGTAFWFSLVTVTTVGYGDFYPVTGLGRVIGLFFVLMGTVLLTVAIGVVVSFTFGKALPLIKLRFNKKKNVYVMSELNEKSAYLAQNIAKNDENVMIVFAEEEAGRNVESCQHLLEKIKYVSVNIGLTKLVNYIKVRPEKLFLFFISEDEEKNYYDALSRVGTKSQIYALADRGLLTEKRPQNMVLFDPKDCMARMFWQKHPLNPSVKDVVIIGFESCGQKIFSRGILTNIFSPNQNICYHIFGNSKEYQCEHRELKNVLSVNRQTSTGDSVVFHDAEWYEDERLLRKADRIIICYNDMEANQVCVQKLKTYFVTTGEVFVLTDKRYDGIKSFGSPKDYLNVKFVMQKELNRLAVSMHEIYYTMSGGQAPSWDDLGELAKLSNIAAADHLRTKINILLEEYKFHELTKELCENAYRKYIAESGEKADLFRKVEHIRWMRFHVLFNWQYDAKRDNALRKHPSLLPFEELSLEEQMKDDYAWSLIGKIYE